MCITRFQFKVQDSAAQHLPQVQEVQERFDKYRELAAVQLEEAKKKIKSLEHQLDDRIIEADMAKNKAKEEMGENHTAGHNRHSMMNNRQWDTLEASVKSSFLSSFALWPTPEMAAPATSRTVALWRRRARGPVENLNGSNLS
jgi:NADH dehydrogenase/NADH:ubiquinone oxidoreductase subunit G